MASLYESKSYKDFIRSELDSERFGRGTRVLLSKHLNVQMSYLSLVLGGQQDFTLEHGLKIADFLGLDASDTKWFLLLMSRDKAGSVLLRRHYEQELAEIKSQRSAIQSELKTKDKLSEEDLHEYYSTWYCTVIHMAIRNPILRDPDSISKTFKISRAKTIQSLKTLEKIGFAKTEKGKWIPTNRRFHFGKTSFALKAHHINWRQMAIRSLDDGAEEDLHFSSVMSMDSQTKEKVRAAILECIKGLEPSIEKAEDREVIALTIDLFKVT